MSKRRALTSGVVLADRYELQDQVSQRLGSVTWRALDLVLNRNVGIELIPSSDPRAPHFLEAARRSTLVTDARFLRVLDLLEDQHGHYAVVREWAKAFGLNQVLAQSPVPSRRAAQIVAEVAEALAHAHEHGLYHRRLTPHHVLVKQSGAVRVVGLGLASALDDPNHTESSADLTAYEQADVRALGNLLYASLTGRWPGAGGVDELPTAPAEHGHTLRPRQVRAGVARDVDAICDRILPELAGPHTAGRLSSAEDIARALRVVAGEHRDTAIPGQSPINPAHASPDLLRSDPVVEPAGPLPGLTVTRRPKAYEPPPPTRRERAQALAVDATKGDRRFVLAGVVGTLVLLVVIGVLALQTGGVNVPFTGDDAPRTLPVEGAQDFDPDGDGAENPDDVDLAIDGNPDTGWHTTTYFNRPELGGLKDGVGLIVDLGTVRQVSEARLTLGGDPTSLTIYGMRSATRPPDTLSGLVNLGTAPDAGGTARVKLKKGAETRFLVVWLTSLPETEAGRFQGEIREISVRGQA